MHLDWANAFLDLLLLPLHALLACHTVDYAENGWMNSVALVREKNEGLAGRIMPPPLPLLPPLGRWPPPATIDVLGPN